MHCKCSGHERSGRKRRRPPPQQEEGHTFRKRSWVPAGILWMSVLVAIHQAPTSEAFLSPSSSSLWTFPRHCSLPISSSSSSSRHVSSIKSWFSMVTTTRNQNLTRPPKSIFFQKKNKTHDETTMLDESNHNTTSTTNTTTTATTTTWANLLHEDNSTASSSSSSSGTPPSAGKRDAIQNGIFDPSFTLWQFPEYSSAWTNSFSMIPPPNNSNSNKATTATPKATTATKTSSSSPPVQFSPNATARPSLFIPAHLKPGDTLTVADLQAILQGSSSYAITPWTATPETTKPMSAKEALLMPSSSSTSGTTPMMPPSSGKTKQGVAFPQASVINYKSLQRGTTFASAMTGMILATTLLPNLWLMGLLVGGIYGYDLCSRPDEPPPSGLVARTFIQWGRFLATTVLSFMDSCRTLWFLYKTGELSYQYYKSYELMDQRFNIQSKMDAWNARFQEGKLKFDQWEQENEIGRTVLASLRTVWLVDERSRRRAQKSRYRVVQSLYDGKYWATRWTRKTWKKIQNSNWSSTVQEYWKGIRTDLMQGRGGSSSWGTRLGAIVATLIAVNITGALFAISPALLATIAVVIGMAWPSWVSELTNRLKDLTLETRARGRGETVAHTAADNYYFFQRKESPKRQSFLTGQRSSSSSNNNAKKKTKTTTSPSFAWPWSKPQRVRRPPCKEQWGLFSR